MSKKSKIVFSFRVGKVKVRKKPVRSTRVENPVKGGGYKRVKRVDGEQ